MTKCHFCQTTFQVPGAVVTSSSGGGGGWAGGNTEAPLPKKGRDPLGGCVTKGIWSSIREGHELVYLSARDRILDWESSGRFHLWNYDRTVSNGDPLPNAQAEGSWGSIGAGHELISLGGDHVLDWESSSGFYRVWQYDRNAHGNRDIFPDIVTKGTWSSIASSKRLISLGGDRLLDWEPSSGAFRIWAYDRSVRSGGDPLPGGPVVEGAWGSIRTGHELVYCGNDCVLDWVPGSGNYRLWSFDRHARGSGDPLPRELAAGNWASIRGNHRLISLEGNRVLDWEPDSGAYRIWEFVS